MISDMATLHPFFGKEGVAERALIQDLPFTTDN